MQVFRIFTKMHTPYSGHRGRLGASSRKGLGGEVENRER